MTSTICPHCAEPISSADLVCAHCGRRTSESEFAAVKTVSSPRQVTRSAGTPAGTWLLVIGGIGACLIGLVSLTQATFGVGFMAGGCFLAIWARIIQAGAFQKESMSR